MTNPTQNTKKQSVSFDNLRNISDINNTQLVKMSKDADLMRTALEEKAKQIRTMLRDIDVNKNVVAQKTP
ncbi:MAG: hypothetical protein J6C13_02070, partial [Clostridia bacterium]|nr:hypothetical protein [Clostridia bacterium]